MIVVSSDGTELYARDEGAGVPMLFVHGTGSGLGDWSLVARQLRSDFRVISYDRRGRGRSGDGEYSFEREIDDLFAVVAAVGEAPHVVAHSFGARIALQAAEQLDVRSLTLYEPPLDVRSGPPDVYPRIAAASERQDWDEVLRLFHGLANMSEESATLRDNAVVWQSLVDAAPTVLRELAALARTPVGVPQVSVPVQFLLGGATDVPVFLNGLGELATGLSAAIQRIDGERHIAMITSADAVTALIRAFAENVNA